MIFGCPVRVKSLNNALGKAAWVLQEDDNCQELYDTNRVGELVVMAKHQPLQR